MYEHLKKLAQNRKMLHVVLNTNGLGSTFCLRFYFEIIHNVKIRNLDI